MTKRRKTFATQDYLVEVIVLGSARTGLAFTRIQESAQPGGLTQPQPGQTEQGIPYHVPSHWVQVGGASTTGNSLAARKRGRRPCPGQRLSGLCGSHRFISLSVSLLLLFPLFAVLLNCPYPDPPVSACFFSILLHTPAGGGAAVWRFLLLAAAKTKTLNWCPSVGQR